MERDGAAFALGDADALETAKLLAGTGGRGDQVGQVELDDFVAVPADGIAYGDGDFRPVRSGRGMFRGGGRYGPDCETEELSCGWRS